MVAATSIRSHSANLRYWMLSSGIVFLSRISSKSFVRPLRSTMSWRNLRQNISILSSDRGTSSPSLMVNHSTYSSM